MSKTLAVQALISARNTHHKNIEAISNIFITVTVALFTGIGVLVYHAEFKDQQPNYKYYLYLVFITGFFGLFVAYTRTLTYIWSIYAAKIDQKIAKLTSYPRLLLPPQKKIHSLPLLIFNLSVVVALLYWFYISLYKSTKVALDPSSEFYFILFSKMIMIVNIIAFHGYIKNWTQFNNFSLTKLIDRIKRKV